MISVTKRKWLLHNYFPIEELFIKKTWLTKQHIGIVLEELYYSYWHSRILELTDPNKIRKK